MEKLVFDLEAILSHIMYAVPVITRGTCVAQMGLRFEIETIVMETHYISNIQVLVLQTFKVCSVFGF